MRYLITRMHVGDPKVRQAFKFAETVHKGQYRDDGFTDYLEHPMAVADIVAGIVKHSDDNMIIAALLHDTIEDTAVTYEEILERFGKDVADLVNEVTHEGQKDDYGFYFPRLKTRRGIMLKLADRMHNLSDMGMWDDKRQQHYLNKTKFWKDGSDK